MENNYQLQYIDRRRVACGHRSRPPQFLEKNAAFRLLSYENVIGSTLTTVWTLIRVDVTRRLEMKRPRVRRQICSKHL